MWGSIYTNGYEKMKEASDDMALEFDINRLQNVYAATIQSLDKATAFEIEIDKGRFLLMMFLSDEDHELKDMLVVYMRNTGMLQKIKLNGNHEKGSFQVFISDELKECFMQELQLEPGNGEFDLGRFLSELNENIPLEISQEKRVKVLRNNREIIRTLHVVDEAEKSVLIGDKHLSAGTPQDRTFRKLFLYTDANPKDIIQLTNLLKKLNRTVMWATEEDKHRATNVERMIHWLNVFNWED